MFFCLFLFLLQLWYCVLGAPIFGSNYFNFKTINNDDIALTSDRSIALADVNGITFWSGAGTQLDTISTSPVVATGLVWDRELDVLCVGATNGIYIYKQSPGWTLSASKVFTGDGSILDMHKGWVVVKKSDTSVEVYRYNSSLLTLNATLNSSFSGVSSVAVYRDTIVVGTPSGFDIFLFTSSQAWVKDKTFSVTGISSIDLGGETIAVGISSSNLIRMYRILNNQWVYTENIQYSGTSSNAQFGSGVSVATNGLVVVVAALGINDGKSEGLSFAYVWNNTIWTQHQILSSWQGTGFGQLNTECDIMITSSGYIVATLIALGNPGHSENGAATYSYDCSTNTTGIGCNVNCLCKNGYCYTGMWSPPSCSSCLPKSAGNYCNISCSCVNGKCNEGLNGNGKCLSCNSPSGNETGWIGENCSTPCSCVNGRCDSGLLGTGSCLGCNLEFYGQNCSSQCNCSTNETCFFGVNGNGTCFSSTCPKLTFGPTCQNCTCTNGICSEGIVGTGLCIECNKGFFGENCSECLCENGICDDGIDRTGICLSCNETWSGYYCNIPRTCVNGTASEGLDGDGTCISCYPGWFGKNCDSSCTCSNNGVCNDGIEGDGLCSSCSENSFGINCEFNCTCSGGQCFFGPNGDGNCLYCYSNFTAFNDSLCIACPRQVNCDGITTPIITDQDTFFLDTIFNSSLLIQNSSVLTLNFILSGDMITTYSQLTVGKGETLINGDASFTSSGISLYADLTVTGRLNLNGVIINSNESIINVYDCVNLDNVTFIIDYTNEPESITVISAKCSNVSDTHLIFTTSASSCKVVSGYTPSMANGLQFSIIYDNSACNVILPVDPITNKWWFMLAVSMGVLFLIVATILVVVFSSPSLRERVFPYRERPPDYQTSMKRSNA